jgi:RNA polymerase sigma-70 factor (sigma-E family)
MDVHSGAMIVERPATLADLHRAQYAPMVRLAALLLGSREQAEDVVQDCFVRVYPRFEELREPVPYLRTAVVNACRSAGRRQARARKVAATHIADLVSDLGAREMLDALDSLSSRQRTAIVLRFYEDMSEEEMASALGCRPGTVKSLVHRGLAHLREVLGE